MFARHRIPVGRFAAIAACLVLSVGSALADPVVVRPQIPTLPDDGKGHFAGTRTDSLGGLGISINAGSGLAANAQAMAAFNRAAQQWMSKISDPISVVIDADLASLDAGVLGQASTSLFRFGYDTVRNAMVADAAAGGDPNDAIVAALPTLNQVSAYLPSGFGLANTMLLASANAKALGLDVNLAGSPDARITFSSDFAFDYDNSDGVDAGKIDFETVAAHEIGHALGFFSAVDTVDFALAGGQRGNIEMNPLDLFRFWDQDKPTTAEEFRDGPRMLRTDYGAVTSTVDKNYAMSTGAFTGDGRQASHWKDDDLLGQSYIGIMDPTLASGTVEHIKDSDLLALSLIGYNINYGTAAVPEPATCLMLGLGALGASAASRRRRRAA